MTQIPEDNIRNENTSIEIPKDNTRNENLSKEKATEKNKMKQTILVKDKIKIKTLDDLGEIEEAKKHRSANRPLHKISDFNNKVNFCWCCNLPCEEKGIIEPFHYCDSVNKFSECGLGVSFYFYFFRFLIFILLICICVIVISMMVFNKHYTKGINRVCNNSFKKYGFNNLTLCEGYVTEVKEDLNVYVRFMKDWVLTFSSDNIRIYYLLHSNITGESDNAEDVIINYSFLNFFLLITVFILNIGYIILINARAKKNKFKNLSIRDYTVLISNAKHILIDYFHEMKRQNPGYVYQSQQLVENTEDFIEHVKKYILEDKDLTELKINNVNLCYDLGEFMVLRDKLERCKEKIFKIKNNPYLIKINSKKANLIKERYYYFMPLEDFGIHCLRIRDKPLKEIEKEKKELEKKIEYEIKNNYQKISEENFTGYMFVSFEYIKDKEKIMAKYPNQFFDIMLHFFKNIKYYLCCCCVSKGENIKFNKIKGIDVDDPPEPEDLYWENFKYNGRNRFIRIVIFFLICILIIGVSFCIVLGFTYWQNKITDNEKNINLFVKYLLSLFITIITAILNAVLELLLEKFTFLERHLSRTNYYLSLSVKIAIFTFLNSAVVPLIAKELAVKKRIKDISYNIDRNNLIVDDMFVMFLVNAFVTPIFWTLNIPYLIKKIRIYCLEKKKNPNQSHYMTQRQLNKLYEYPDMYISYKYAYLAKTTAMSIFYLPIFPMGFIISFLGFILGYLLELYNFTHLYKRPEMLDESITRAYTDNFIIILFIGGIGDFFFFYEIFPNKGFSIANFVIFLVLIFVPYTKFINCNFIGEKKKSERYPESLTEVYLDFYIDYQRHNPFTKRLALRHYLDELKKEGNLSDNAYQMAKENLDKLNLMEIYYGISRGNIPIIHQSVMANTNNYSISGKNINLRRSSVKNDVRQSIQDQKEKQRYFDYQMNLIFKPRQSNLESIIEEPDKYPMDTTEDEIDTKDRLINAYNNPLAINMGLGPLPMDYNVYNTIPLDESKDNEPNDNEIVDNSIQEFKNKNSKDIRDKIKKDIDNYRNKKNSEEKIKKENKNISNNSITESSLDMNKNNPNFALHKSDQDSESKEINVNMPFKASIHQSQNTITNKNIMSSTNSLAYKNKNLEQDNNRMPLDTSMQNINEINEKDNSDNEINNDFGNLYDIDSSKNKINNEDNNNLNLENNLINNYNNSDSKNLTNLVHQNEGSNNQNNDDINQSINKNVNINNISPIRLSKSSFSDNLNLDNKDINNIAFPLDNEQNNINLSKSFNKENNNDFEFKAQPEDSE